MFSQDEWDLHVATSYEVCLGNVHTEVGVHRFSADDHDPPLEMGFPAVLVTIRPALHGYQGTDGDRIHMGGGPLTHITLNMN